jgi:predicted RNA binding protein YcfA (HicA-like mRNA interferase family)
MHLHDVERLLANRGYLLDRVRGSHRHYRDESGRRLTLTHHTGKGGLGRSELARLERDIARLDAHSARCTYCSR